MSKTTSHFALSPQGVPSRPKKQRFYSQTIILSEILATYKGEIACHCGRISMQFDHNLDPRIGS